MKVKRETYLEKLRQLRDSNLIKVVAGMRRVGKSTLLADFRARTVCLPQHVSR
jgi:Predicted ATPase (AAA+ superfamily)